MLEAFPPTQMASVSVWASRISKFGHCPWQAPQYMHFSSTTSNVGLPFMNAGRMAATGQMATTLGCSQIPIPRA